MGGGPEAHEEAEAGSPTFNVKRQLVVEERSLETLGWILVIALPAFLLAWWGTGLKKRADLHRRQDAPEVRPYWVPEELFKASIYTAEGNKYRRQAALFLYLYPLLWMVLVFAVANVIGRWL